MTICHQVSVSFSKTDFFIWKTILQSKIYKTNYCVSIMRFFFSMNVMFEGSNFILSSDILLIGIGLSFGYQVPWNIKIIESPQLNRRKMTKSNLTGRNLSVHGV